jgi:hypothetical protein
VTTAACLLLLVVAPSTGRALGVPNTLMVVLMRTCRGDELVNSTMSASVSYQRHNTRCMTTGLREFLNLNTLAAVWPSICIRRCVATTIRETC